MDLTSVFVDKGIYKLKTLSKDIFLCEALSANQIGRLILYKKLTKNIYERTNISYFLNICQEGDIKELFITRENYDMIGKIGNNYKQVNTYLIKE